MVGMNPDSKIHVEGVAATVTGLGIRDDNRSDLEKPFADPGMCNAQFAHENDTSNLSCELCGVLRDLSLYFNNISEAEAGELMLSAETNILEYLYWQDLLLQHLIQSQRLLLSLMAPKRIQMQQRISKLP
ncbi:hypothetical protein PVAP13_4KG197062 [Panicum virgatum]|uniref:Uncharacterized protein n=1 Tax=Panicum virgatum TaxID=38727 RepID=A0A8T0TN84_PANVG|nr:hypothetical protein PVAP13_4KG197062 [Panicum virgatum]